MSGKQKMPGDAFDIDVALTRGQQRIAVRIAAEAGLVALVGRSGAGKSSVLDMIAGLLRPDSGRIVIGGEALFDHDAGICLPPEGRACGYVFQDLRLFPHRTVAQNLSFGWRLAPADRRFMEPEEAANFLGIGHLLARHPATLSGGEAQRVAIGRALLAGPRVLLMDEPLTGLDAPRRAEVMAVIERIRDELRLPILYVSHAAAEVERLANRVIEMD